MLWFPLFGILVTFVIIKIYKNTNYWRDRGVTHIKSWPVFGSATSSLFRKCSLSEQIEYLYKKYPEAKFIGLHQFGTPVLMLRDPELIKQITVKDFDSFMNHRVILKEDSEPIFGKNLISLKGQKWKDMRSILSPAFTSSKMRAMNTLITECAEQFTNYFLNEAQTEHDVVTVEMKDIFTRYTNDVIATAAFGIQCDSLQHKENEFYMAGKSSTKFGSLAVLKIIAYILVPRFMKYSGITLIDKRITGFFSDLILNTIKVRAKNVIVRPDMIHLLMQAQRGNLKHENISEDAGFATVEESLIGMTRKENKPELTDEDIVAQAFIFFFAGYDTGSTVMSFMAYELALNPEIQKQLQEEVDAVANEGRIDYDHVLKMKYLDMVVSETLRKWSPFSFTDRICEKSYVINTLNDSQSSLHIDVGTPVWIPIYAIHRDDKYFPNPEYFDPERFNDENIHNIAPFTYLPFGVGPRNCIGSRFALLEIKILFVHLLKKFEFTITENTQIPVKLHKKGFNMSSEKGIWLGMKLRNSL